jgi:uncharacterized protein YkwD
MNVRRAWLGLILVLAGRAGAGEEPEDLFEALCAQMLELVNRARAEEKVAPLSFHKGAAAVARAHCLDMKANRFFSHESKRTGKVKDRVTKAGIPHRGVAENLARADTVENCFKSLMRSPGHRKNILQPDFAYIGIAFARNDRGLLLCTQVFIQPTPVYDLAEVRRQIVDGINKTRLAKGRRRLILDAKLELQALSHSQRASQLDRPDPIWLEDRLARNDKRWRMHEVAYFLTDKPPDVIGCDVAQSVRYDHFGVGVVQAPAKSKGAGALWVTLICAQRK